MSVMHYILNLWYMYKNKCKKSKNTLCCLPLKKTGAAKNNLITRTQVEPSRLVSVP